MNLRSSLFLSAAAGGFVAAQAHLNGLLGADMHNPYLAGFLSCSIGMLALLGFHLPSRTSRAALREIPGAYRRKALPWWALTGGFSGAFLVFAQSATIGALGVALFSVGTVAGQVIGGMVIDWSGIGTGKTIGLSLRRILSAIVAVMAIVIGGLLDGSGVSLLLAIPVIAGFGTGWQAAVNGVMRRVIGSVVATTLVNFFVGWVLLLAATIVSLFHLGFPALWPTDLFVYSGGLFGVLYVGLSAFLVRRNGVLVLGLSIISGQLLASLLIDQFSPHTQNPTLNVFVGVGLALMAMLISKPRKVNG